MQTLSSSLIRQAKRGSGDAMDHLFRMCGERLLALIRSRLGRDLRRRFESRDILQATMLKAFEKIDGFNGADRASVMAWLVRIAENEIRDQVDHHRRQRRNPAAEVPVERAVELTARVRSQSSRIALSEDMERVEKGLESVSDDYREVILLRYIGELSYRDIGRRMGRSPDACRVLLARAMAALTAVVGDG